MVMMTMVIMMMVMMMMISSAPRVRPPLGLLLQVVLRHAGSGSCKPFHWGRPSVWHRLSLDLGCAGGVVQKVSVLGAVRERVLGNLALMVGAGDSSSASASSSSSLSLLLVVVRR